MKKLLIVFSIILLTGCTDGGLFAKSPKEFIDAIDLGFAYEENENQASDDYDDLFIQVTGIVKFIFEGKDDTKIHLYGGIICTFTDDLESIKEIKKYNMIIINGSVEGLVDDQSVSSVSIEKCELIEVITSPEIVTTAEQASTLNLGEIGYEVIEITGTIYSFDFGYRWGFDFVTDDVYDLGVDFEDDFDLSSLEVGDTVTVMGVVMPFDSFLSPDGYKIYGYNISNIIKNN